MPSDLIRLQSVPRQVTRWQAAQQELLANRHARALASYRDLVQRFPGVPQLWVELGMAAIGELQFPLAEQAFAKARQLAGREAPVLLVLAQQYQRLRRLDDARACFEQAVATDPTSLSARLSLAAWYERERRLQEAWSCLEACATGQPNNPQVICARALLLHRLGHHSKAEAILRDVVGGPSQDSNVKFSSRHLLAVVLDELEQYEEAMRWLNEAKAQARLLNNTARLEQDYDRADRQRRELLAGLTPDMLRRWREESPVPKPDFRLAFLGGHPRSGTTLLEQVLAAHPGLQAFDEPTAFAEEIWQALAPMDAVRPLTAHALDRLNPSQRGRLAERYRKSLLRETAGAGANQILLDKNPSPTAALHLWLRVFPHLKIIIALRDPRDVVLSCYFQNLMLTPTNANFLSLERTAKHYADLMDTWLRLRELGGFDWVETRYEDLVAEVRAEGQRVTEFLGLSWHAAQEKHHESTGQRHLFSPTYSDAAKPVHQRAVGRWQHYAAALEPIQTRLASYCRAFGYGA